MNEWTKDKATPVQIHLTKHLTDQLAPAASCGAGLPNHCGAQGWVPSGLPPHLLPLKAAAYACVAHLTTTQCFAGTVSKLGL